MAFPRSAWLLAGASLVVTIAPLACGRIRADDGALDDTVDVPDASTGIARRGDAARDAFDSSAADAGVDASAVLDAADAAVILPAIDPALPDPEPACAPSAGTAYLVAENASLYAFDPRAVTTRKLGTIACPTSATPWTMTVTQTDAYVLFNDWNLYRVRLDTLACTRTAYSSGQLGYPGDVGIGTSAGPDASLFVYGSQNGNGVHDLAMSDLSTFALAEVGRIAPLPVISYPVDIKVDGYGRLFASDFTGDLLMVDATSGRVLGLDHTGLVTSSAWALLTYDDGVYFFMGDGGDAYRWDLVTKKATRLGTIGDRIVGAGAAPCLH